MFLTPELGACKLSEIRTYASRPIRIILKVPKSQELRRGRTAQMTSTRTNSLRVPKLYRGTSVSVRLCILLVIASLGCGSVCFAQKKKGQQPPPPNAPPAKPYVKPVAQSKIGIETSPQLFATMCALWAAGFNTEANLGSLPPEWAAVASKMAKMQGPATDALREYYNQHEHNNRTDTLTRYISFAMVVGPAPNFAYALRPEEIPPDVVPIQDFNEVLAKFYQEAQLDLLWAQLQPAYNPAISRLQPPMTKIVLETTAYLREVIRTDSPQTFTVYVEPFVGMNLNFRTYLDHYVVVLDGGETVKLDQLRHAFLHFLLDALPIHYDAAIVPSRPLLKIAATAPRLPFEYKNDFTGLYAECLIRAVEIQLDHLPVDRRARAIDAAEADGFILVRPLAAQLEKFQVSEPSMRLYFPEMAAAINVGDETRRLKDVKFAPAVEAAPEVAVDAGVLAARAEAVEKERTLEQAERLIVAKDAPGAQAAFEKIDKRWPGTPRATYGLAVSAMMQGDPDRAKELFLSVAKSAREGAAIAPNDAGVVAWAHVYLGRFNDLDNNRNDALVEYRAALAVPGAPASARQAAQNGVQKAFRASADGGTI